MDARLANLARARDVLTERRRQRADAAVLGPGAAAGALVPAVVAPRPPELTQETFRLLCEPRAPFQTSPLTWALHVAGRLVSVAPDDDLDADVLAIVREQCVDPLPTRCKLQSGHAADVPRWKLNSSLPLIASCVSACDRVAVHRFVAAIAKMPVSKLLFIDSARYDETPMRLTTREQEVRLFWSRAPGKAMMRARTSTLAKDTTVGKLFQTESRWGVLLKFDLPPGSSDNPYVMIIGETVNWIQILSSTTAESLYAALLTTDAVTDATHAFSNKVRHATTDKYGANLVAEARMTKHRNNTSPTPWFGLHEPCDAHIVSAVHTKTFALTEDFISGLINVSLSLGGGDNMRRFRKCLAADIDNRLLIKFGEPPPDAVEYRKVILSLFLARGPRAAERRALLTKCAPGDWRNLDNIEFYCAHGSQPNRGDIVYLVQDGLLVALAHRSYSTYPRHRWTGCDISTDEIGILAACSGILGRVYKAFLQTFPKANRPVRAAGEAGAAAILPLAAPDTVPAIMDADRPVPAPAGEVGGNAAEAPTETWQEAQARHRRLGEAFVESEPLGLLMIARTCMEPLRILLAAHFRLASDKWERQQRATEVANSFSHAAGGKPREHRIAIAAEMKLEDDLDMRLRSLMFTPEPWVHLPREWQSVAGRSLILRMLARIGCAVAELLRLPHRRFHNRLFMLLSDPTLYDVFKHEPRCVLGEWSYAMLQQWDEDSDGADVLMQLRLLALLIKKDISKIETMHATIRRLLVGMSVQTHSVEGPILCSKWVCDNVRRRRIEKTKGKFVKPAATSKQVTTARSRAPKVKKCSGGGCRAYASVHHAPGGRPDWGRLSAECNALSPEAKAYYVELGRLATIAGRGMSATKSAFGVTFGKAQKAARRKLRRAVADRGRDQLSDEALVAQLSAAVLQESADGPGDFFQSVQLVQSLARAGARSSGEASAREDARIDCALATFTQDVGNRQVAKFMAAAPELSTFAEALVAIPHSPCPLFDYNPDSGLVGGKIAAWASRHATDSNLSSALQSDWTMKTWPISPGPAHCGGGEDDAAHLRPSKCQLAAVCLCSEEGKNLDKFCKNLLTALKPMVKAKSAARRTLLDGKLVCRLTWTRSDVDDDHVAAAPVGAPPPPQRQGDVWMHIGMMYLSPYRPSWHLVERRRDGEGLVYGPGIPMKATGRYNDFYSPLADLELDHRTWTLRAYQIYESGQPCAHFIPAYFEVVDVAGTDERQYWPRLTRRRADRRPDDDPAAPGHDGDHGVGGGPGDELGDEHGQGDDEDGDEPDKDGLHALDD
ncbi:unnamed protein product, partial [Prorocentrum cordatum]